MKRIVQIILLLILLYLAKPLWEKPVSQYIDVSFFDALDEKVQLVVNKESIDAAISFILDKTELTLHFVTSGGTVEQEAYVKAEKPTLEKPAHSPFAIHNIEIGSSLEVVKQQLGEPQKRMLNEYGVEWLLFHDHYHHFVMLSVNDQQQVNALYTNDDVISSSIGIQYGTTKGKVREQLGKPITEIRKGLNIHLLQEHPGFDVFLKGNVYIYVFYDLHQGGKVTALQLIAEELEQKKAGFYASGNDTLGKGFEQQLFELTNAARVRHGLHPLHWDELVAHTARKHSEDMALHHYFSHDNLQGLSPFDRMKNDGIVFAGAGENLAYGQSSSIFAHEGLMNSKGHRDNILTKQYSHLGIGVAFNEKSQPYYTENFLLK